MATNIPLSVAAKVIMGQSPPGDTYNEFGVGLPLLNGPTEFGPTYPECSLFTTGSRRECEPGDLIFCVRGSTTGRMNWADKKYSLGRGVCAFRAPSRAETRFVRYCIQDKLHALLQLAGGGTFPNLTKETIESFEIPWPEERARIAGILSAYDELIENSQRRIKILEEMARALYREWFVNFKYPGHEKVPLVDSPLGKIPKGWEVKPFTDAADVLSGGTPKTDVADYWNGEIPFFTPRDAPGCFYVNDCEKHITEHGLSKCASSLYPPDTVFITARGTVGKVALPSVPMAMNQSCYALQGKLGFSQRYLFLLTLQQVDYLKTNTGGATFDTIVVDTFRRMQVVIPPRAVVADFTVQVDAMFDEVNTLQCQIQTLRRTRDLLLPRLLSGQINVEAIT